MTTDVNLILETLNNFEKAEEQIYFQIRQICFYSQGSVTYQDALFMSPKERIEWVEFIQSEFDKKQEQMSGNEVIRQKEL